MRVEANQGYVLHRRDYRETSLLLEVFSFAYGRVALVARGARRRRTPRFCPLQPFRPLQVGWVGRGDLVTLTSAEECGPGIQLMGRKLLSGMYLNELLMRLLLRHDPHPELFVAYGQTLGLLGQAAQEEPVLRLFEKRLLEELGYGLVLEREAETGALIQGDAVYYYQSGKGPVLAKPVSAPSVRIHGRTLTSLRESVLDEPLVLRELKVLMRFLLAPLIGERPLQIRQLFQEKRRDTGSATR